MLTDEQIRNIHKAMDGAEKIASDQEKLRDQGIIWLIGNVRLCCCGIRG